MTSDKPQGETNQEIFDEYVKYLLGGSGFQYMDESIEHIVETIEHGEASVETALNLIARAHVTAMVSACPTHLNSHSAKEIVDEETALAVWIVQIVNQIPKIASALEKCVDMVIEGISDSAGDSEILTDSQVLRILLPQMYSATTLDRLERRNLFGGKLALDASFLLALAKETPQSDKESDGQADTGPTTGLGHLAGNLSLDIKPSIRSLPSWYWYRIGYQISECLRTADSITFAEWVDIVDFVADLMRQSEMEDDEWQDIDYERGSEPPYLAWSAENWAWQFGRVVALLYLAEPDPEITNGEPPADWGLDVDFIRNWDNGLAIQSLIAQGPRLGRLEDFSQLEAGLYAALNGRLDAQDATYDTNDALLPSNQLPSSRLYWIMRLGYIEGVDSIGANRDDSDDQATTPTQAAEPTAGSASSWQGITGLNGHHGALLIAPSSDNGRPIATSQEELVAQLHNALPGIWDTLPRDVQWYLIRAEHALGSPLDPLHYPALEFLKAVEAALGLFLTKPKELHFKLWPGKRVGKWIGALIGMSSTLNELDSLQMHLRHQFDSAYARELSERLTIISENRNADAHDSDDVSLPYQARDSVLGKDGSRSVFELILRFARKWPPK